MHCVQKEVIMFLQVISEYPQLKGYERNVDHVLGKSLIQAKHYQRKRLKVYVYSYF